MILDAANKSLEIVLGEAMTTAEMDVTASYGDYAGPAFIPGAADTVTNGVTPVTVVAAPGAGTQRLAQEIRAYNADTVPHTLLLQLNRGGTIRIIEAATVPVGGSFLYAPTVRSEDAAPAQIVDSAVLAGAAVALTTATPLDVTSVTLGPGRWLLTGAVYFTGAAGTTITRVVGSISDTLDTLDLLPGRYSDAYLAAAAFSVIGEDVSAVGMAVTVAPGGSTTYHLVAQANFAVSTLGAYGLITAVEIL